MDEDDSKKRFSLYEGLSSTEIGNHLKDKSSPY